MIKKTILLLIFSVILTSCVPYKQLEELGIINTRGVDVTENNRVETTIIAYQFDAQNPQITTSITGVGKT
ncbi:Ger(x)C family spore germination protein, partial [Staphylococcus sp. SIMBA_130]